MEQSILVERQASKMTDYVKKTDKELKRMEEEKKEQLGKVEDKLDEVKK